jgi:hypothetical protein
MDANEYTPKTLVDAIRYYSDEDRCIAYMVSRRWPDGIVKCRQPAPVEVQQQARPPSVQR